MNTSLIARRFQQPTKRANDERLNGYQMNSKKRGMCQPRRFLTRRRKIPDKTRLDRPTTKSLTHADAIRKLWHAGSSPGSTASRAFAVFRSAIWLRRSPTMWLNG
jgi:hypothetical protein